jgi:hypothetical protein
MTLVKLLLLNVCVSFEEAQAFCATLSIKYGECSSKDNIGIEDTLFEIINDVIHSAPEYHQEC